MTDLFLDLETFCEVPITNGTHAYAEQVEITLFAWALDDGTVDVVDVTNGEPLPNALVDAMLDDDVIVWAHNSGFDRTVLRHVMPDLCPPIHRWRDTMVQALSHSLPGGLGQLCEILKISDTDAKDKEGRELVMLFCKPRPASSKLRRATRDTHPEQWAKFVSYAGRDISAMRAIRKAMPQWNYQGRELDLWHLDQRINDRGMCMDVELAQSAMEAVGKAQKSLAKRAVDITDGAVQAATQRDAMLKHILAEYGIDLPDMQKSTLERRINDPDLPAAMRELLGIRLQASTTSTAKYKALLNGVSSDGRLRGTKQFNGAMRTGRWAGRLFQPDNLPRPTLKQDVIDAGVEALKADCADLITDNVMELTSSAIRGCIVAPRGKKLVVSDLSNIEGRDQAWLAGETWKLDAFRAYDAGTGHDLYKLAYAKSFGIRPEDVTKDQRQVGKVQELALGYEGGVGAFLTFAAAYNIDLEVMADDAYDSIPDVIIREATEMLAWTKKRKRPAFGLSDKAWIVCESFKRSWRYAHPNIASLWRELADAARLAISRPGLTVECRYLKLRRDGAWLRIRLPSGRALCYPSPQLEGDVITYMGVNQYSRKWSRLKTYGGKLFENVCQAVARDVMAHNMPLIEAAGYEIVLTVHDEVICEAPDSEDFNDKHLSSLLANNPPWASDMPLAAGGFEAYRYRKD
jgi:DNA polymerase